MYNQTGKLEYINNLDGVRGCAAIMVLVFHFFFNGSVEHSDYLQVFQVLTEFGQHGVSLFFVLSGFVITRILIKTKKEGQRTFFRNFYIRRVLRIFPLYYFYLLINYFVLPYVFSKEIPNLLLQFPYYFYLQNFNVIFDFERSGPGHFWSLAVEEHFYLFWPLVVYFAPVKRLLSISILMIGLTFIVKYFLLSKGVAINFFTFTRIDQIIMGGLVAVLEYNSKLNKAFVSIKMIAVSLLIIFTIGTVVYLFSQHFYFIKEMFKYSILGLFFTVFIVFVVVNKDLSLVKNVFENKFILYVGKISYGFYVYHILALNLLKEFFLTKIVIVDLLLSFLLTVAFAHLSFNFFESRFLILKERLSKSVVG